MKEALKLALEFIENSECGTADLEARIKKALAQPEQERPVDCERCNRLEEQAYDLVGKLRVANIKLSMQPQRTWVGLTDEDWDEIFGNALTIGEAIKVTEAKLKQKNGYAEEKNT